MKQMILEKIASNYLQDAIQNEYNEYLRHLIIAEYEDLISFTSIALKDEYKGIGIGTKLMNDVINYANKKGKPIRIEPSNVFGSRKSSIVKFVKKIGFIQDENDRKFYMKYPNNLLHYELI